MASKSGYIAIYLCDSSIHAIEFDHGYKSIVLQGYGSVDLPNGIVKNGRIVEPNALQEKIKNLLVSTVPNPIKSKELLFVVPDDLTFTQLFNMPGKVEGEQLKEMIPEEAEKYIPFSRDDVYWDYAKGDASDGNTTVQYSAISKSILEEYLNLFKNLGLKPILVTNSHEAYKILPTVTNKKTPAALELNKDNIKLLCIKDNIINSISTFEFNHAQFLENIAQYIDPDKHVLTVNELPLLDPLVDQIKLEMQNDSCLKDIKSLNIWGEALKDTYLYKYLEAKIGLHFNVDELWDPISLSSDVNNSKRAIESINKNKIQFGILASISMVFFYDQSTKCVNLLPEKERKDFGTKAFSRLLGFVGLLILTMNIGLIFILSYFALDYTFEFQKLDKETKNFEELIYGKRYTELKENILSFNSEVNKLYTLDNSIVDLPEVYEKLITISPEGVSLSRLSYSKEAGNLIVNGVADTRSTLLSYKSKLDAMDGIGEIDFPISNLDKSNDISFEISIELNPTDET